MANMEKLKRKMKQRGVTYSELSRKMDINRSTLYRKSASEGDCFSVREAVYIGRTLGLSLAETAEIFLESSRIFAIMIVLCYFLYYTAIP